LLFDVSAKSKKTKNSALSAALRRTIFFKNPFRITIVPPLLGVVIDSSNFVSLDVMFR